MATQNTASKVKVITDEYVRTYATNPKGRGGWYFFTDESLSFDMPYAMAQGTYAEARKMAKKWAAQQGHDTLFVGT